MLYLKGEKKKGIWPNKPVPASHLLPCFHIHSQYLAQHSRHMLSPCSPFPFSSPVWQPALCNMIQLLPQRARNAQTQWSGKATDSSQQGHLAGLTVSMAVFIQEWADKAISFQVEKHKLHLYADNFLLAGFSTTGWISVLFLQQSLTTWNIYHCQGERCFARSWRRAAGWAEVEGHNQAHLLRLFWEVEIWTTASRCSLQLLTPLLTIFSGQTTYASIKNYN